MVIAYIGKMKDRSMVEGSMIKSGQMHIRVPFLSILLFVNEAL